MKTRIPGLLDCHVHVRDMEQAQKETWDSCSQAALAGGVTTILAMPNTKPALTERSAFDRYHTLASQTSRCDFGIHVGATVDNASSIHALSAQSTGLKMYLDATFGDMKMDRLDALASHMDAWPTEVPVLVHAEERTMAAAILCAQLSNRSLHICHVSLKAEIELILRAKERGIQVTCEVCPHHLFLTEESHGLVQGFCEVRPLLATPKDAEALWSHMDVIDCFATDHAPHTPIEKASEKPPPGFPGLETALPLWLTAVHDDRITLEQLVEKSCTNPRRIFACPLPEDTWVEIDVDASWDIRSEDLKTRSAWTPFAGKRVWGRVEEVTLRGTIAFTQGEVLAAPGSGQSVR